MHRLRWPRDGASKIRQLFTFIICFFLTNERVLSSDGKFSVNKRNNMGKGEYLFGAEGEKLGKHV
jgi:hypothetical protein